MSTARFFTNPFATGDAGAGESAEIERLVCNEPRRLRARLLQRAARLTFTSAAHVNERLAEATVVSTPSPRHVGACFYTGASAGLGMVLYRIARTADALFDAPQIVSTSDLEVEFASFSEVCIRFALEEAGQDPVPLTEKGLHRISGHCLQQAHRLLSICEAANDNAGSPRASFLEGPNGVSTLLYVLRQQLHPSSASRDAQRLLSLLRKDSRRCEGSNELLYGRIGVIYSLMFAQMYGNDDPGWLEEAERAVQVLLDEGKRLADKRARGALPLYYEWHGKAYLGAAHGLVGILYILSQLPSCEYSEEIQQLEDECCKHVVAGQLHSGNFPTKIVLDSDDFADASRHDRLVQWCHGSPGIIPLLCLQSEHSSGAELYMAAAERAAADIWRRGLLCKGVGLCHGIAGNAYAMLRLFQTRKKIGKGDNTYLIRAVAFAEFAWRQMEMLQDVPDHPDSLFEGTQGFICLLLDLVLALEGLDILGIPGFDI